MQRNSSNTSFNHPLYMQRCFDLARLAQGQVSPNPMVGAVLVHEDRIIGEGYHARYGGDHAEVMCVKSVKAKDQHLISKSRLYVSLEPCNIYGNTPPCTNLILDQKIPHLIVASGDQTPGVQGSGLQRLRDAGVKVEVGVGREQGTYLSRIRNTFVEKNRPYIVLKYAQTRNGFLAPKEQEQYWLTNQFSKTLVHKWRTETDAILVGSGTAMVDNPALTNRLYPGKQPMRIVLDRKAKIPHSHHLFDQQHASMVFTQKAMCNDGLVEYEQLDFNASNWLTQLLRKLAERKIAHLTVEGGAWLLEQFVANQLWDEARVFTTQHEWADGLKAPLLGIAPTQEYKLAEDELRVYYAAI